MKGLFIFRPGDWCRSLRLATRHDLQKFKEEIMSKISDYAAQVGTAFDRISGSVDSLVKSQEGIGRDIKQLKDTIDKLQNSPGTITPADQALLDQTQSQANALADKLNTFATNLKALDDATENTPEPPADTGDTPPVPQ